MSCDKNEARIAANLIAFEGIDGSGKSTQAKLLLNALRRNSVPAEYISFPRTSERGYGEAIAMFLRGEFGSVEAVHPYLVAALFAGDRAAARRVMEEWLEASRIIIADRYFYSNLAFQSAKIDGLQNKDKFLDWLRHVEYSCNEIPEPSITLFFDAPFHFVEANIRARVVEHRPYLNGLADIHEAALHLQQEVAHEYRGFAQTDSQFKIIRCADPNGRMRTADSIHKEVLSLLLDAGIIAAECLECR